MEDRRPETKDRRKISHRDRQRTQRRIIFIVGERLAGKVQTGYYILFLFHGFIEG